MLAYILISLLVALSGCGGGGGGADTFDVEAVKSQISAALSQFESGVEEYNVAKMLANFSDGDDFRLIIAEGDWSYDKTYTTLKQELDDDAPAQQAWRKPVADGGYDYKLEMNLGGLNYSHLSDSGGFAWQTFEVWESAADIPEIMTDYGKITWQMVKKAGVWTVVGMTIEFRGLTDSSIQSSNRMQINRGFGFSKILR